jgi:hypothetical protein
VGTWKMNVAKSTFNDSPPPRRELQICEAVGRDTIRLKIVRVDASGKEIRSEYTAQYDGKDHPFPGSLWDTIALSIGPEHERSSLQEEWQHGPDFDRQRVEGWEGAYANCEINRCFRSADITHRSV